ncbi:4Fe-4S dicluster domain-containing protein [bacterium]|nr:4Fe-4S dicluster domain-containing protein [bacterium]
MKRRDFLWLVGVISGSTVMSACGSPNRSAKFTSYLLPPEKGVVPGEASFHPSTCTECPAGCGVLARVREGRPVKLEGIPGHPVSDGGLCVRGQSSLYRLYHPERLRGPMVRDGKTFRSIPWEEAFSRVAGSLKGSREKGRKNLFLSGRTTGSLSRTADAACERLEIERLPEYEVYSHTAVKEANALLFGERDVPHYRIEEADFLLTVGADLLETYVTPVAYTRKISSARSRGGFLWYHVEPHMSLTGANADRRYTVAPGRETLLLSFLLREVLEKKPPKDRMPGELLAAFPPTTAENVSRDTGIPPESVKEIADRFIAAKRPLLVAGGVGTAQTGGLRVAAAAGLLQWVTGAIPERVDFARSENHRAVGTLRDMEELSARLGRGEAGVVFLFRTNPVFSLPPRLAFKENLKKADLSVGMGEFLDETLRETDLVLPLSHSLESWGDVEPRRGVVSLLQPVLPPLHDTLSDGDALLRLLGNVSGRGAPGSYEELLLAAWRKRLGEAGRSRLLEKGYAEETLPKKAVLFDGKRAAKSLRVPGKAEGTVQPALVLAPSLRTFDGRSRVLPILSEIPDPLTTITYGPWISVSEEAARRAGLRDRDEVTVASADWKAVLPVKVQPGLPAGVFVVHRDAIPAPPIRTDPRTGGPVDIIESVRITKTGKTVAIPILSGSFSQRGRGLIPDPVHLEEGRHHERWTLYPEHDHKEYRWAMAVDLERCNGCAACVAACHVENNVPVVGKKDHLKGREMSWLRIEPFYEKGGVDFLPMLCQQCHSAPCESVCPVFAAHHNPEGLNVQVYARCVGTRYCSNNCPYKVRRFNWWQHRWPEPMDRMLNPDAPPREVGVMEKCTFCLQRIRAAKDKAKDEGRNVRDGEFTTACAQSCPTGAIVFGNLLDKESKVYRLVHSERAYRVFESLGTEPSIHYLRGGKP